MPASLVVSASSLVVTPGDTFADRGQGQFTLPLESDREGYEILLASLVGQNMVPDRILHLWSVTQGAQFRGDQYGVDRAAQLGPVKTGQDFRRRVRVGLRNPPCCGPI